MPGRYLIANWKMNVPPEGLEAYFAAVNAGAVGGEVSVVVTPPFVYIDAAARLAGSVTIGAQNCSDQESGAFTGEVSAAMLASRGVRCVIAGHSERRQLYGETSAMVARKIERAIAAQLLPVLCVGEDLSVRESGGAAAFVARQIEAAGSRALEQAGQVVIAYEPVWAIGTGRNASGAMVAETVAGIREAVGRFWPSRHGDAPVLYGGSVTPENIGDLWANGGIDGFLVGGASLDSTKFLAILRGMTMA
jgi:triosephosphate isomerase